MFSQSFWRIHCARVGVCLGAACFCSAGTAQLNIPEPGVRLEAGAGISSVSEYRDIVLARSSSAHAFAGIAYYGFSASMWASSGAVDWHEFALAYSHKFPLVDVHLSYVNTRLGNGINWGRDTVRLSVSNNLSADTHVLAFIERPLGHNGRHGYSAVLTQRLGNVGPVDIAFRASTSTVRTPGQRSEGTSVKLLTGWAAKGDARWDGHLALNRSVHNANTAERKSAAFVGLSFTKNF